MATSSSAEERWRDGFQPVATPFVWRPVAIVALVMAPIVGTLLFFWESVRRTIGWSVYGIPSLAAVVLLGLTVHRLVRLWKTEYRIRSDRVIVETGHLFGERTVELDVENVTLVEWTSPFFLRVFYGAGHVTIEEAGSGERPARMLYVDDPGRLYEFVGEVMEERGFSLARRRVVEQQEPGHLGAAVDFVEHYIGGIGTLGIVLIQAAPQLLALELAAIVGAVGRAYRAGVRVIDAATASRATMLILAVFVTLVGLVLALVWVGATYVDLLRRRYTLHDDVIDYVDGFLTETHKFVPLENIADTEVSRPVYKRILGLSDVTLSPEGAKNEVTFRSTPRGPEFARAVEKLLRDAGPPTRGDREDRGASARSDRGGQSSEAPPSADVGSITPHLGRAASLGVSKAPVAVLALAVVVFDAGASSYHLGPVEVAGIVGVVAVVTGAVLISTLGGAVWWMVTAMATEFRFDRREVTSTYRLLRTNESRFKTDRITSVTIVKWPLDWAFGTMTVHFRSVGADQNIKFWSIEDTPETRRALRESLNVSRRTSDGSGGLDTTPSWRLRDAISASAPIQLLVAIGLIGLVVALEMASISIGPEVWAFWALGCATMFGGWHALRAVQHRVTTGSIDDEHLEMREGLLRRRHHLVPLEGIKAIASHRYPGSDAGTLVLSTPRFPLRIGHVREVEEVHRALDDRLASRDVAGEEVVQESPRAGALALQYSWTMLFGIGVAVVPAIYSYYRRVRYRLAPQSLVADYGIYFARRKTVQYQRVDHIETDRGLAQYLTDTRSVEIYTVGTPTSELVFRSIPRTSSVYDELRRRLDGD